MCIFVHWPIIWCHKFKKADRRGCMSDFLIRKSYRGGIEMKDVYFCMLTNNQSTINHKIPFYTAKSYHSTILVRYEGPGVSRLRHFFFWEFKILVWCDMTWWSCENNQNNYHRPSLSRYVYLMSYFFKTFFLYGEGLYGHMGIFYTANSYHSTNLVQYKGLGVSRFVAFVPKKIPICL